MTSFLTTLALRNIGQSKQPWLRSFAHLSRKSPIPRQGRDQTRCGCRRWFAEEAQKAEKIEKPSPKPKGLQPFTWKVALGTMALGGAMLAGMLYVKSIKDAERERKQKKSVGKAALGGSWELVDQNGKLRKSSDFEGKWMLLYFGFTHCPDVCPEELEKIIEAVDMVDAKPKVPNVLPVFISVDPDRDSPEAVKDYVLEFSPKMLGLTGTKEQLEMVTKAYRVFFSVGPKDEDNDYIVDHSIITYLIGPDGQFVNYYGQNRKAQDIANDIEYHMVKYESSK